MQLSQISLAVTRLGQVYDPRMDLFGAGEVGVWYDPSDLSTMFQDAAGTVPVTGVEQPVGLLLDKSRGLVLGPELVVNGDFSNGTTGWTAGAGASIARSTAVFPDGGLLVTANGGPFSYGIQVVNGLTAGKRYVLSARVYSPSTNAANNRATIGIQVSGFTSAGSIAQLATDQIQTISIQFIASGTSQTIYCSVVTSNFHSFGTHGSVAHFDNISVRELPGNHATQTTTTSRPILRQEAGGQYYLAFDGTDDWLQTGPINFTSTDKMTVVAGVRKLSDAGPGAVAELSEASFVNGKTFALFGPSAAGLPNYFWRSHGTANVTAVTGNSFSAPTTGVLTGIGDIAADVCVLRVNGTQAASSTNDQGTGAYGNYPLYIGRRGGTTMPFTGHLYGLIVRGAASSAAQIAAAERFMAQKTGVTL